MDINPQTHAGMTALACQAISQIITTIAVDAGSVGRTLVLDRAKLFKRFKANNAQLRLARAAVSRRKPFAALPILGPLIVEPGEKRLTAAKKSREKLKERIQALDRKTRSARRLEAKCFEVVGSLDICGIDAAKLGEPPIELKGKIRTASNRALTLSRRRDRRKVKDILATADGILEVVGEWRAHLAACKTIQERASASAGATSAIPIKPAPRIFLPIPISMEREALRLGAHIDKSVTKSSRIFLTPSDDLRPFARMLPLAYRHGGAKLRFPPIPAKAARHNIWSMFDQETWNRVRYSAYEAAGRRCIICGGHGGYFARRVLGQDNRGAIDCHETWNWTVEDPTSGVGLQRLDRLLTVCVDCHMLFHEGFALTQARNVGLRDEAFERINERRRLVNQMDDPALTLLLEEDQENWRATDGIDNWVVDLGHLSGHMPVGTDPIFMVDNEAGVAPERIGGLAFQTNDGRNFPNRPAEEVFRAEMKRSEDNFQRLREGHASYIARGLGSS